MSVLEIMRAKKRRGELLTASETVIWEACWQGINNRDVHQMKLAETAANELAAKDARIAELETALEVTYTAMQKVRDDIPEMAYAAIITLVPEWVDAWDLIQKAGLPAAAQVGTS